MEKIVIVGGVAAGSTAAAKVRRISSTANITMIESGPDISFANCGLPYYIGGDIKTRAKLILQSPESFKDQYNVDAYTHTTVSSINRIAHTINTVNSQSGEQKSFEYTKLILAQGGRPVIPELPGAGLSHVFTLWTLEDMDKIAHYLDEKGLKNAVVVGGGFIGIEMVEALVKRGLKVHVVEMMPHVMGLMEAETAGFIQKEMLSHGVEVHCNVGVKEILSDTVKLENGTILKAEMVLLSVGVRPVLQLAIEAGLTIGEAGGILVNEMLQTSDPDIYAAGDMIETEHSVNGQKVRIPLAGPANRQGRIVAENALGGNHKYKGTLGTSIVRVFSAIAGMTGLSVKQALAAGFNADSVVVHKEHHTSYYPGAEMVSVMLIYDRQTGIILGGQTAGYKGADKRLDVIATLAATKSTIHDLADIDFAYSPPVGTPNDALNMVAYAAENKVSGFSPSVTVGELDSYLEGKNPFFIDVRDYFSYEKNHIIGSINIPPDLMLKQLHNIPGNRLIVVYDETGKKGHHAIRTLVGAGFKQVVNISGGFISLQRQALVSDFKNIKINIDPIELKKAQTEITAEPKNSEITGLNDNVPIIIDVRTPQEFMVGAVPGAINIPLDDLSKQINKLGRFSRDITVYCASGGRSAYAQKLLKQAGFSDVKNGGGIAMMMSRNLI